MPQSAARRKVRVHRSCQLTCGDGQQLPVLERADVGEVVQVACSHTGKEQSARRGRMILATCTGAGAGHDLRRSR